MKQINIKPKNHKVKSLATKKFSWPIKVLILTFCLSASFSVFSELVNSKVGIAISLVIIIVFIIVNVCFDIIGVAATVCEKEKITKKNSDFKACELIAFKIVNNNEKVCSFCCDIIGDICGILSGSAGASLIFKFHISLTNAELILLSTLISALIASITVFAKALGKNFAIKNSAKIILSVSKFLGTFIKKKKQKDKNDN